MAAMTRISRIFSGVIVMAWVAASLTVLAANESTATRRMDGVTSVRAGGSRTGQRLRIISRSTCDA
jgi:hypothetical protein